MSQLVDFIEDENRIVRARAAQGLNNLAGHGADIGAAMTADFGLVVHAAERDALEFAPQRTRDGSPERSFSDTGRADEAEDRSFESRLELHDGEKVEDAVLDLLQIVVIFVQNLRRALHVDGFAG